MAIKNKNKELRGFTIFFAMLVGGLALAIGLAIYDLTLRELDLSQTATQSHYAIYAADTGVECALYWENRCALGNCPVGTAFASSTQSAFPVSGVSCNGQDVAAVGTPPATYAAPPTGWSGWVVETGASSATTTFTLSFAPSQTYCTKVQVIKQGSPVQTTIISRGYNTCLSGGQLRLERVLYVTF